MFDRFKQHIQSNFSYVEKAKILVAISGGLDSVVLVHLLSNLNYKIGLAHVNYQLRDDESERDEVFVKQLAKQLKLPFFIHRVNTTAFSKKTGLSIQMAAREIRYNWFDEVIGEKKYDFVLTAHHLDDSIETFFINLNRSTGLEGLTGIPAKNNKIIRPLLVFSRAEIEEYAVKNKLKWREDTSNATTKYERNKIRHKLVPVLEDINPQFSDAFSNTQSYLQGSQSLVNDYISLLKSMFWTEKDGLISISLKDLYDLPNLKTILFELLKDYGFTEWEDVFMLVKGQTGKRVFSNTHVLLKDRGNLMLSSVEKEKRELDVIEVRDNFKIDNVIFKIDELSDIKTFKPSNPCDICFDKNKVNFPLFVRKWKKGDYFYPLGMRGKKKLSNFLIDQKVSRLEKEKIWLLCDAKKNIVWVIGYRLDDRFKITENTTEIIQISQQT